MFEFLLFFAFLLPLLILVGQIISQLRNFPKTFRVAEMMIATSLIATALAALGPWGMIVVGLALATWVSIVCASTRGGRWVSLLVGTWLTAITSLMMLAIPPARAMAVKMNSSDHLKQIALAMHNYNDTYGSYPPAFLADDQGVPQHSWRVLLLPYFEQQALYQQYDLWRTPHSGIGPRPKRRMVCGDGRWQRAMDQLGRIGRPVAGAGQACRGQRPCASRT